MDNLVIPVDPKVIQSQKRDGITSESLWILRLSVQKKILSCDLRDASASKNTVGTFVIHEHYLSHVSHP